MREQWNIRYIAMSRKRHKNRSNRWSCIQVKQMQPVWVCILSGRQFGNADRKKVEQMQPVWLCILFGRHFKTHPWKRPSKWNEHLDFYKNEHLISNHLISDEVFYIQLWKCQYNAMMDGWCKANNKLLCRTEHFRNGNWIQTAQSNISCFKPTHL